MQIGMIGLGKMGSNMVRRMMTAGLGCVVYDLNPAQVERLEAEGAIAASSMHDLIGRLGSPRTVWLMLPAGEPTESAVMSLSEYLKAEDCILDGGNAHYKDDMRRAKIVGRKGIHYVDAGTSGGVWGLQRGYCLMLGGDSGVIRRLEPIFRALATSSR
jgi:6-phosphogluconate dehydrogenase